MPTHDQRFAGQRVVVTGGSSGIGRLAALRFAAEGAAVGVVDLREDAGVLAEVEAAGAQVEFAPADVSSAADFSGAFGRIAGALGGVDVMVNNAGQNIAGDFEDYSLDDYDRVMAVNCKSVFVGSQLAARHMLERGTGTIVNVSSNFGLVGMPRMAAFCGAKGAVVAMTRALAAELGPRGVRVNVVCPGWTRTPAIEHLVSDGGWHERMGRRTPLQPPEGDFVSEPEDVAALIAFAASSEARTLTGAALVMDGGWHAT